MGQEGFDGKNDQATQRDRIRCATRDRLRRPWAVP
jgi:hypothetical protein